MWVGADPGVFAVVTRQLAGRKSCVCCDAECCCEVDFDVGEVGPAVHAMQVVMIVPCDNEVHLSRSRGGKLVAVMRDVIILCKLWNVAACRNVKCLLKCVKRDEARGKNAVSTSLYNLKKS